LGELLVLEEGHRIAPRISVVVPVFNAALFVEKAVRSAVNLPEVLEVVLVEDGSRDGSPAVCARLEDELEKVRVLRHPRGENRGAAASRNLGILEASGDHIAFLDADDYYLPWRFEDSAGILSRSEDVDGVYEATGVEFLDPSRKDEWLSLGRPPEIYTFKRRLPPEKLLAALSRSYGCFTTDSILVRRQIFQKVGLFDEELRISQDTAMWWKMALVARLVPGQLDKPVAMRLVHPGNRSTDVEKLGEAQRRLWRLLWDWCRDRDLALGKRRFVLARYLSSELHYPGSDPVVIRQMKALARLTRFLRSSSKPARITALDAAYAYFFFSGLPNLARRIRWLFFGREP